jgi:hypothetical protein
MTALLSYVTGCDSGGFSSPNEELVIEYEVTEAIVHPNQTSEPFPYILTISMRRITGGGRRYEYYNDRENTKQILGDTLVTVNGKPPSGVNKSMSGDYGGAEFSVYLDFLPYEGDEVLFYQGWFFAYPPYEFPKDREKVRIITKSLLIK